MRRGLLGLVLVVPILAGAGAAYYLNRPTTLTVLVGPADGEDHRLALALRNLLHRANAEIRLKVVTTSGPAASASQLEARRGELAVVRSDTEYPADGLLVALLRRDVALFLSRPDGTVEEIGHLAGRGLGLVATQETDRRLLRRILAHYEVSENVLALESFSSIDEAGAALAAKRIDAIFAVGSPVARTLADIVQRVEGAIGGTPRFVPVGDAEVIAGRSHIVEAGEIARGAFGGAAPRPPETVTTVGVAHRLVAHRDTSESSIAALTRLLFALRPALTATLPLAAEIEAPDTDRGAAVPVHPGAIAYVEGTVESLFDRLSNSFYLIVMVGGIIGSAVAWIASLFQREAQTRRMQDLRETLSLLAAARVAPDRPALDEIEQRLDELFAGTLAQGASPDLDPMHVAAFALAFDQARRAVIERRRALPVKRRLALAAE